MGLTKCKTCQKEIAKSAKACPGCGAKQGGRAGTLIMLGLVAVIAIGVVSAADKKKKQKEEVASGGDSVEVVSVTAQRLFEDYEANEVSADAKYKGKVLRVTGKVAKIRKNAFSDAPVVELATSNQFEGVDAEFVDASAAGSLKRGQQVTVRCRGKGHLMGPRMEDCVLE